VPARFTEEEVMSAIYTRLRTAAIPLLAPVAFGVLTACSGDDRKLDDQLRADLMAASQAPANRQQFMGPAEMGYPQGYAPGYQQGYAPYPGQVPQGYPQPYPPQAYPAPYPQPAPTRVVYVPQPSTVRRTSTAGSGSGSGSGGSGVYQERRNTQKGAIIGAASGAAIGVISSRDKAKGAAIGALGGAVLGGLIGHQVKNP
jgi:YMGG-like Gly-zipper